MIKKNLPKVRTDLEFIPVLHQGQQLILVRDHLGFVPEGHALGAPLYQMLALLDGSADIRDFQMEMMRRSGGRLVSMDEIDRILHYLDKSYLLESGRFQSAKDKAVRDFSAMDVRPCYHCGQAYPKGPLELKRRLDEILSGEAILWKPPGKLRALIAPHIDMAAGHRIYSLVYRMLAYTEPARVILLGIGHRLSRDLFSLTDKDFDTPLGVVRSDRVPISRLRGVSRDLIAANDFEHRAEHSIEFQILFLQHLLKQDSFKIIPILCGPVSPSLPDYSRKSYVEKAGPLLQGLREILEDSADDTLIIAGVDFSHVGPKFGHNMPAEYLQSQSSGHDKKLLECLSHLDAEGFWEESSRVKDRFNVCGFAALACLLEVLGSCTGRLLDYQVWHEEATKSAVGFAGMVFT